MAHFIMHEVIDVKGRCFEPLTELAKYQDLCRWDDGKKTQLVYLMVEYDRDECQVLVGYDRYIVYNILIYMCLFY